MSPFFAPVLDTPLRLSIPASTVGVQKGSCHVGKEIPMAKKKKQQATKRAVEPGHLASSGGKALRTYDVGALPIINRILERMRLADILKQCLPADDARTQLATHRGLLVLLRNILMSREPVYGVGQWAASYAPHLFDMGHHEMERLNDDRVGRCLDRLFEALDADLIMRVVRRVIEQFHINLDELHNDSTSVSVYGAYRGAEEEGRVRGRPTLAITFGHSKDHRPDLKQLLYILTVSNDGGVPLYFTSASGNTTDDTTHRQTWDLLHQLVGRADFLYVADCKLATSDNMNYIARQHGRFITVLPRSRKEDQQFRQRLLKKPDSIRWDELYTVSKKITIKGQVFLKPVDRLSSSAEEMTSKEGYRLLWYHSSKKVDLDSQRRARQLQRATQVLLELRDRLQGPKTRFRERGKVDAAVQKILKTVRGRVAVAGGRTGAREAHLSTGQQGSSGKRHQVHQERDDIVRHLLERRSDSPGRSGIAGWHLSLDHQRERLDSRGSAARLQTPADHREAFLATENGLCGGSDLFEIGHTNSSLAGRVLLRADRADVTGT